MQTNSKTPVILISSPGQDPLEDIMNLARQENIRSEINFLSLGENQENIGLEMLENSCENGNWMIIQNAHLLVALIKDIERYLDNSRTVHDDFRLWITTKPIDTFPIGMLQSSLKVVTESPKSLKLGLNFMFSNMEPEILNYCEHSAYRPLLYVLSFFHGVIQERQKFGWNVSYDFNKCDLNMSLGILSNYLTKIVSLKENRLQWDGLKYLIGEVNCSLVLV